MINDEDEKELIECPPPSFVKILDFESLLDSDNALGKTTEMVCESVHSTDENFIGIVDNKPCVYMNKTDPSISLNKQINKNSIKTTIGINKVVTKQPSRSFIYENKTKYYQYKG